MSARLVFLVMAHQLPRQFHRLVDRLGGHPVVAHIDATADAAPFARADVIPAPRVAVNWGGYSCVRAMLSLLRTARRTHPDATHLMLLSGMDYPARPLPELRDLLEADPEVSHIAHADMTAPGAQFPDIPREWCSLDLYRRLHLDEPRMSRLLRRLPPRRMPHGWTPWRGSTSWALTAVAADHVLATLTDDHRLRRYLSTIRIPDEIAFPTILTNGPLAASLSPRQGTAAPLHYIDWSPRREDPAILDLSDLDRILASGKPFIRKVAPGRSDALMDVLDRIR